ncbi:hypothetical protein DWB68_13315 [Galactobacter valiniphilus]|uniref:Uncharacterized protein n=2 Tax=Galactobacter valiniphilus TaxID=2676122 RepID=A0A399J741_9MICC|nr:hypothetical protein DWB68_13315 [Galactobacter valiniphilus]
MTVMDFTPRIKEAAARVQAEREARPDLSAAEFEECWLQQQERVESDRPEGYGRLGWFPDNNILVSGDFQAHQRGMRHQSRAHFIVIEREDGRSEVHAKVDPNHL